nr:ABC transporter ATP-binding protein [Treponema pedis]
MKRLNTFENFKEENNENIDENFIAVKLTAENISFKYAENNFLFKNFNYEAKKGYLNVIAGESGKGKTTLAKLLLNLYEPESGEIYFTDAQNKKHKINKKNVSYIPQDCKLFTKTVYENILDGKPDADKNEIGKAARKAMAHLFIEERKEKYNSYIDNSSGVFSYGQKQRIAIARAVLKNAELIIFDEPTSALDEENEKNIISLLIELAKEKIVIVVSHSQNIIDKSCTGRSSRN